MEHCPHCLAAVIFGTKFCPSCGSPMTLLTATSVDAPIENAARQRPERSGSAAYGGRFIPGTLLGGRYRLVALLGRGAMGEVYRAEDTRLGQTVALKFLPDALERDPEMLEGLYAEMRIGRQVSHPNVCRLHDLIDIEGHHCLSMEYVDGEDLSVLLSRIGRLPAEKVIDIARDLCAGLAAAHDKGVIHRDLKPANVMIDGKGRARIADFGIAALAECIDREALAGTPAYMAPELMNGQSASQSSDIYALGMVLFELCTGKRPVQASAKDALLEPGNAARPLGLSDSVRDIPVALERVVLRCLERDPLARPESARAVMAALPGGDPLQAAMAAGETPSPAMVAAAGKVGALRAPTAWALLLCTVLTLLLSAWISASSTLIGRIHPQKSPEVLSAKAREILGALGYDEPVRDTHASFTVDVDALKYSTKQQLAAPVAPDLVYARPGPLLFVYRQSPGKLLAEHIQMRPFGPAEVGRIGIDDPAPTLPGMLDLLLDIEGRLVALRAVSPSVTNAAARADWVPLLQAAGFDPATLNSATPRVSVPVDSDLKVAWEGSFPDQPEVRLHIEAAALGGRAVWFGIQGPWSTPASLPLSSTPLVSSTLPLAVRIAIWTLLGTSVLLWVTIGALLRRNLRLGRVDRQGALRLTLFLMSAALIGLLLRADHIALAFEEAGLVSNLLAQVVLYGGIIWLSYMALEPTARRRWPQLLVSWTRLLSGRWHDPLVGRDVLIGVLAGIWMALVLNLAIVIPAWLGLPTPAPRAQVISTVSAFRHLLYFVFSSPFAAVTISFGALLGLVVYRAIFRHHGLALTIQALSIYFAFAVFTGASGIWSVPGALFTLIYLAVLLRAGVLAAVVAFYGFQIIEATPLTLDLSCWYMDRTIASFALLAGLSIFGFKIALAGKPLLGALWLERDDS